MPEYFLNQFYLVKNLRLIYNDRTMPEIVKELHKKHPSMPMSQVFKEAGKVYRAQPGVPAKKDTKKKGGNKGGDGGIRLPLRAASRPASAAQGLVTQEKNHS